jgi:hypothetical protein
VGKVIILRSVNSLYGRVFSALLCITEYTRFVKSVHSLPSRWVYLQAVFKAHNIDTDLYANDRDKDYDKLRGMHASRPRTLGN